MEIKDHHEHHYEPGLKDTAEKPATVDKALRKKVQRFKEQQSEPMRFDMVARRAKISLFMEDAKETD